MGQAHASRRRVVQGIAVGGMALPLLAACGAVGDPKPKAGSKVGPSSDVKAGGGHIFPDAQVVVTELTAGDFKAYTAVCTHTGCIVSKIEGGDIVCPCHGSRFSLKDGSVINGPAPAPLAPMKIKVAGGEITIV